MNVAILNGDGKPVGTQEVLKTWERREVVPALLHQAVVTALANARINRAHTKGRGEVRGGGRKPWAQKGTGRARHGSIRSPIWRGGGTVFGPTKEENYGKRFPASMRRAALGMALLAKVRDAEIRMVEAFPESAKTKDLAAFLKRVNLTGSRLLIPPPEQQATVVRAGRNLPRTRILHPAQLQAADLLRIKMLVVTPQSWAILEDRLVRKTTPRAPKPKAP